MYELSCNNCLQLQPDRIFSSSNDSDKNRSLRKKWSKLMIALVTAWRDFWREFLNQCVFCAPLRLRSRVDLSRFSGRRICLSLHAGLTHHESQVNLSIFRDYGPAAERRWREEGKPSPIIRIGKVGPEDFGEMWNVRQRIVDRREAGLPNAPHEEPADDDAEPRAEACEARSKQPGAADSDASIATTDSGAGADGANGGAANRATADATGGAAAGTADSEGAGELAVTQPYEPPDPHDVVEAAEAKAEQAETKQADAVKARDEAEAEVKAATPGAATKRTKRLESQPVILHTLTHCLARAYALFTGRPVIMYRSTCAEAEDALTAARLTVAAASDELNIARDELETARRNAHAADEDAANAAAAKSAKAGDPKRAQAPDASRESASATADGRTDGPVLSVKYPSGMRNSQPADKRKVRARVGVPAVARARACAKAQHAPRTTRTHSALAGLLPARPLPDAGRADQVFHPAGEGEHGVRAGPHAVRGRPAGAARTRQDPRRAVQPGTRRTVRMHTPTCIVFCAAVGAHASSCVFVWVDL